MEPEKKSNGAFIGLIVIIIILIVGGIYLWQNNKGNITENPDMIMTDDANSLDSLEQDLNDLDSNIGVDVDNLE